MSSDSGSPNPSLDPLPGTRNARSVKRDRSPSPAPPSLPGGRLIAQIKEIEALTSRPPSHHEKLNRTVPSVLKNSFPTRRGPRVGPDYQAVLPSPVPKGAGAPPAPTKEPAAPQEPAC